MLSCMYDESNISSPFYMYCIIYQMLAICTGLHSCMRMVYAIATGAPTGSGEMPRMF